ncbi:C5a anaphylatoxin chemotactic receptor 2 isoform X2 [Crocuta crocuta]
MRTLLQETVSGAWMENATLSYEYGDYAGVPDLPVDCVDAPCGSTHPLSTAPFLLYAAVFLVGVPGNAVVAWVAGGEARRRAGATWFLHLAVADLLCCLSLPLLAVPLALGGHWPFGALGCRALSSAILLSMYAGVLLLAALSVDLCLGALRLHQEHFPRRLQCVLGCGGSAAVENTVTATRFIFGFLGPLVVVAACHGALLCRAARHRWLLGTAVVVGFFVCWAPYHALGLVITVAAPHSRLLARALRAEPLVTGLALAHSCLNPMLFLYFGRTQLRRSLPAACRWALKESQSKDASVASKKSTSHDLVSEADV